MFITWQCAQRLRATYQAKDLTDPGSRAYRSDAALVGHTAFLAHFTTGRSSNGGTEAMNSIIELHRRLACGYRNSDNYRLRMLLAPGGLTLQSPPDRRRTG